MPTRTLRRTRTKRNTPTLFRLFTFDNRFQFACAYRLRQGLVVFLALISIRDGEFGNRLVEGVVLAKVAGDKRGFTGAGMGAGKGPAATVGKEHHLGGVERLNGELDFGIAQLTDVVVPAL